MKSSLGFLGLLAVGMKAGNALVFASVAWSIPLEFGDSRILWWISFIAKAVFAYGFGMCLTDFIQAVRKL